MQKYSVKGFEFKADDIVNPDEKDAFRNGRAFIIVESCGYSALIKGIVFADSEQDALDAIVDAGRLQPIDPEEYDDYGVDSDSPECAFLGNASEPFDMEHIHIDEINPGELADALTELANRAEYRLDSGFGRTSRRATVVEKPAYCPQASTMGYSTRWAEPGFFLVLDNGNFARMLGVITDPGDCEGNILVIQMSDNGRFAFERWVDPKNVREVYEKPPSALWSFFTGELPDGRTVIDLASNGTLSESYIERVEETIADIGKRREAFDSLSPGAKFYGGSRAI